MTANLLRASVGPRFLTKVTRLFDSRPLTIFQELIQNSRRAGATEIVVSMTEEVTGYIVVTFKDNGRGIDDLTKILELSESEWEEQTMEDEDPAGMGLFCLAGTGQAVTVTSGGKSVIISPPVFTGEWNAEVEDHEVFVRGTLLIFRLRCSFDFAAKALEDAARYSGNIKLRLNDLPIVAGALVSEDEAQVIDTDLGVRLEVIKPHGYYTGKGKCRVNFHGVVVEWEPTDKALEYLRRYHECGLNVELLHCRHIKMVLPSRNAMVSNAGLGALEHLCCKALFLHAIKHGHSLSFEQATWAATEFGLALPDPDWRTTLTPLVAGSAGSSVVVLEHDHPMLPKKEGLEEFEGAFRVVEPDHRYVGYPTYDGLPKCRHKLMFDQKDVEDWPDDAATEVESIQTCLVFDDRQEVAQLPFVVLCDEGTSGCLDGMDFCVVKRRDFNDFGGIAKAMVDRLFEPWSDYDTDSHETQEEEFEDDAVRWVLRNFVSAAAEFEQQVRNALSPVIWAKSGTGLVLDLRLDFRKEKPEITFTYDP